MNTTLYLLKDVYIDEDHTLTFNNVTAQTDYFFSKRQFTEDNHNYVYLRADNPIKVKYNYDDLMNINYLMYSNAGKWYYAYILGKEYVNPETTRLIIKTDVLQTFQFDYTLDECYIDREHQDRWTYPINPDTGEYNKSMLLPLFNDVAENLNYGRDYTIVSREEIQPDGVTGIQINGKDVKLGWFLVVASNKLTEFGSSSQPIFRTPTPFNLYIIPYDLNNPDTEFRVDAVLTTTTDGYTTVASIHTVLNQYCNTSETLSISFMPYLPLKNLTITLHTDGTSVNINTDFGDILASKIKTGTDTYSNYDYMAYLNANSTNMTSLSDLIKEVSKLGYINTDLQFTTGITTNKDYETKLYTDPYHYFNITNYQTNPLKIKYEHLPLSFKIRYIQNLGSNIKSKWYVDDYLGDHAGKENAVINNTVNDFPLLTDAYKQYMMNNKASATTGVALNVGTTLASTALGVAMAPATGGLSLAVAGGGLLSAGKQIAGEMIKQEDLKQQPDNVRSLGNNIDFDMTDDNLYLRLVRYEITWRYKNILHKYFTHYGYKCGEIKTPDLKSRYYFNYIKTIGANVKGNLDQSILNEIKTLFDKGITLWHYRDSITFNGIKNYSYENIEIELM